MDTKILWEWQEQPGRWDVTRRKDGSAEMILRFKENPYVTQTSVILTREQAQQLGAVLVGDESHHVSFLKEENEHLRAALLERGQEAIARVRRRLWLLPIGAVTGALAVLAGNWLGHWLR